MKNLISLQTRRILKSRHYLVSLSLVLFCFLAFQLILWRSAQFVNYISEFEQLAYLEVVIYIIVFFHATFYAHTKTILETMCFYSKMQIVLGKCVSGILSSMALCLIPIGYVLIGAIFEKTSIIFTTAAVIYVTVRWVMMIGIAHSLGLLIGMIVNNRSAYVLSIPCAIIFSYLNELLFAYLPVSELIQEKIANFFTLQRVFIHGIIVDYVGARVDLFLVVKLICMLLMILIFISVIMLKESKGNRIMLFITLILFIGEFGMTMWWDYLYPVEYNSREKLSLYDENLSPPYIIEEYSGNIDLSEQTNFVCDITMISNERSHFQTILRLDSCFLIKELSVDGKLLNFQRQGDLLIVDLTGIENDKFTIHITYGGRIYYVSELDQLDIFSSWSAAALPPGFAFLPTIDGDNTEKIYRLQVKSGNTIISNLDVNDENGKVMLLGTASSCCIFSGYFTEYEQDGTVFYRSTYNHATNYDDVFERLQTMSHMIANTGKLSEETYDMPHKVFLIHYSYVSNGFPVLYDNYLMYNYGRPAMM